MRLVQSQAATALPGQARPQKGRSMKKLAFALSLACLLAPAWAQAQNAYITNSGDGTVSVINTATNTVVGSITVGNNPIGVAVTPDGSKVYVTNFLDDTVSVINTATNTVVGSPITVGAHPYGVAVTPDGSKVYVANYNGNSVSVIDTATNTVVGSPIAVGNPEGVAVTPDGSKVYVADFVDGRRDRPCRRSRSGSRPAIGNADADIVGLPPDAADAAAEIAPGPGENPHRGRWRRGRPCHRTEHCPTSRRAAPGWSRSSWCPGRPRTPSGRTAARWWRWSGCR
jgi:YVTN family beta-propeller protein